MTKNKGYKYYCKKNIEIRDTNIIANFFAEKNNTEKIIRFLFTFYLFLLYYNICVKIGFYFSNLTLKLVIVV